MFMAPLNFRFRDSNVSSAGFINSCWIIFPFSFFILFVPLFGVGNGYIELESFEFLSSFDIWWNFHFLEIILSTVTAMK